MVEARVAKLFLSDSFFPLTNTSTDHRGWNSCGWHLDDNGRHRGTPPHAVATIFHGTGPCAFPTSVFCQSPTISSSISRDTASHSDCERKQEPIKRSQGQKWRGNISDLPSSWMVWFTCRWLSCWIGRLNPFGKPHDSLRFYHISIPYRIFKLQNCKTHWAWCRSPMYATHLGHASVFGVGYYAS